jgi:hypothetical protein
MNTVILAVAMAVAVTINNHNKETGETGDKEAGETGDVTPDTPDTPITVDPPTEPPKVTGPQPTVNAAEPDQERGRSLRESRWANPDPDFNPIEDRRARGLPGTHRETEERGWLGGPGRWVGNGRGPEREGGPEQEGAREGAREGAWGRPQGTHPI